MSKNEFEEFEEWPSYPTPLTWQERLKRYGRELETATPRQRRRLVKKYHRNGG